MNEEEEEGDDFDTQELLRGRVRKNEYSNYTTTKLLSIASYHTIDNKEEEEEDADNEEDSNESFSIHTNNEKITIQGFNEKLTIQDSQDSSKDITQIFNQKKKLIMYIDSRTNKLIDESYLKKMLPFKEKDFNCIFTFIMKEDEEDDNVSNIYGEGIKLKKIFKPNNQDYFFYEEISQILNDFLIKLNFTNFKEFSFIFLNYCKILMKSGINPKFDILVNYILNFLKNKSNFKKVPKKIQLISRIFSLKNLKINNYFNLKELIDYNSDEDIEFNLTHNNIYKNNWLLKRNFSLKEFHKSNFNILISRAIRYSIFLYWQKRIYLKKFVLNSWFKKFFLIKRTNQLLNNWTKFQKKKILINKFYKEFDKIQNLKKIAIDFYQKYLITYYLKKWKLKSLKVRELINKLIVFEKKKVIKKFIDKSLLINKNNLIAVNFYKKNLIKKFSINLKLKLIFEDQLLKKYYIKWQFKFEKIQIMENDATLLRKAIFCGSKLITWNSKVKLININLLKFSIIIKKKFFQKWLKLLAIKKKFYIFQKNQSIIMKKYIFNSFFLSNFKLLVLKNKIDNSNNSLIIKNYFTSWKNLTLIKTKAKIFENKRLKLLIFKKINENYELKVIEKYYNFNLLKGYFKEWQKKTISNIQLKKFSIVIKTKFFLIWKDSFNEYLKKFRNSERIYYYFLKFKFLKKWHLLKLINDEKIKDADHIFIKNIILNVFLKNFKLKYDSLIKNELTIEEKINKNLKKSFLKKWLKVKNQKKINSLIKIENKFNGNLNIKIKSKYFNSWSANLQRLKVLNHEFENIIKKKFFLKMIKNYLKIDDLKLFSEDFYLKKLKNRYFAILIESSNKKFELKESFNKFLNFKNFKILENTFKFWQFKLIKINQLIQMEILFVKKWNKSKSKNLLLIWYEKYKEFEKMEFTNFLTNTNKKRISPIKSFNKPLLNIDNDKSFESFNEIEQSPSMERQKRMKKNLIFNNNSPTKIYSSTPFKTPNESRIINLSNILSNNDNKSIKSERLKNLKNYYSASIKK